MASWDVPTAERRLIQRSPKGQVVGLLGPHGVGKSTTIKACLGLTRPTRGVVRVFGSTPVTVEARRRMGYSPETPYFYPFLTAEEILALYAGLQGIKSVCASVDQVLEPRTWRPPIATK